MQRRGIFHSVAKGFSQDFQMDGVGYYYICHIILMREFALKIKIYRMNGSYLVRFYDFCPSKEGINCRENGISTI